MAKIEQSEKHKIVLKTLDENLGNGLKNSFRELYEITQLVKLSNDRSYATDYQDMLKSANLA